MPVNKFFKKSQKIKCTGKITLLIIIIYKLSSFTISRDFARKSQNIK